MRNPQYRCLTHRGMPSGRLLERLRTDPFAAGFYDVLRPIDYMQGVIGIDRGHVTGGQPAIGGLRGDLGPAEIAAGDPVSAHLQKPRRRPVSWQTAAEIINDANFVAV